MPHLDRRAPTLTLLILAGAVAAGVLVGRPAPQTAVPVAPRSLEPVRSSVTVHVSGWVVAPGLVDLVDGSRVADALAAAGGARPGARTDLLNLARVVVDGERVEVPGPGETSSDVLGDETVPINRASIEQLESLSGVGPVLAGRIVAYRDEHGPFQAIEDLLGVPGVGESKLDSIRDLISVP